MNTDLVVWSRNEFPVLHRELQSGGLVGLSLAKHGTVWRGCYETDRVKGTPTKDARDMLRTIQNLSPEARQEWKACKRRDLDIGFGGCKQAFSSRWSLNKNLLRGLADVGANLVVTIYREDEQGAVP